MSTQDSAETVERWDELRRMLDDTTLPWRVASQPNPGHAVDGRKWDILAGGPRYIALAVAAVNALPDLLAEVDRLSATQVTQALGTTGGHVLPDPNGGCVCEPFSQSAGGVYVEHLAEYEPACPVHSEHVYNPRTGVWDLAARLAAPDDLRDKVLALADELTARADEPVSGRSVIEIWRGANLAAARSVRALVGDGGGAL